RRIRSYKDGVSPKILILTGYAAQSNIDKALESGADDWLAKPVENAVLLDKVNSLLADVDAGS
ncbi:response regulator, partial [Candidatus Hydrogenedentota bacterium]